MENNKVVRMEKRLEMLIEFEKIMVDSCCLEIEGDFERFEERGEEDEE